jgi:hypothetical protein
MRRKFFIPLLFLASLFIATYFFIRFFSNSEATIDHKVITTSTFNTEIVSNEILSYDRQEIGELCQDPLSDITFEVDGLLIAGDSPLIEGVAFKKNQLLFRINNDDVFVQLAEKKNELIKLFQAILPELDTKFPSEKIKWRTFLEKIKPSLILPEFPLLFAPNERVFLIQKGFIQAMVKVKMLEKEMEKYFFLAPFDGKLIESILPLGEMVPAKTAVARISENRPTTVKITVSKIDLPLYDPKIKVLLKEANGSQIGRGTFLRSSKSTAASHLVDVYYTVRIKKPFEINETTALTVVSKHNTLDKCVALDKSIIKNNEVEVEVNEAKIVKQIKIVAENGENAYVTGLSDGDRVILN